MKTLLMGLAFAVVAVGAVFYLQWEDQGDLVVQDEQVQLAMLKLRDSQPAVREAGVLELGALGARAEEAVPELVRVLKEDELPVRRAAALALGQLGRAASGATGALSVAVLDNDKIVRLNAIRSTGQINKANAVAVVGTKSDGEATGTR